MSNIEHKQTKRDVCIMYLRVNIRSRNIVGFKAKNDNRNYKSTKDHLKPWKVYGCIINGCKLLIKTKQLRFYRQKVFCALHPTSHRLILCIPLVSACATFYVSVHWINLPFLRPKICHHQPISFYATGITRRWMNLRRTENIGKSFGQKNTNYFSVERCNGT